MKTEPARVGARGTDSVQAIDIVHAGALKKLGYDFCVRYLGSTTPAELACILSAGLAFMPVTYASAHDPKAAVSACKMLGLPTGASVWYDLEGPAVFAADPAATIARLNDFAKTLLSAGFAPMIYVGSPQPLTSEELWKLAFVGYWHGAGSVRDRHGALAEPACGWMMAQSNRSHWASGVWVDSDLVTADYRGRVPAWVSA
jgi:hypothetical protein